MIEEVGDVLTLRRILFGGDGEDELLHAVDEQGAAGAVDRRLDPLPPGLRAATREEVVTAVAGVLDQRLVDVLAAGWKRWDELAAAARRTLETPGETEIVELVDHEITSTHHPSVDVTIDGRPVARIEVEVEVAIELHAVTAVVSGGRLSALRSGRADVTAEMAIEGVQVARATRQLALPIEVALGDGIQLAGRSDVVILPPAPSDRPPTP
jgi:hypothetical protein